MRHRLTDNSHIRDLVRAHVSTARMCGWCVERTWRFSRRW